MTIEPRAPAIWSDPSFGDPSFPLAVQAGSYKYKLINVGSRSTGNIVLNVLCNVDRNDSNSDEPVPIDNAYYTIQSEDGTKWATYYIYDWVTNEMSHGASIYKVYSGGGKLSSSNTSDVFPEGSPCWCIWSKEYYDSLVTPISNVNNEISDLNNDISTINNEIDTITPKVDDSFVSATKTNDTTLRLTRNDGTTVDISFPKGVTVRNLNLNTWENLTANQNELLIFSIGIRNYEVDGYTFNLKNKGYADINTSGDDVALTPLTPSKSFDGVIGLFVYITGMLYDGATLQRTNN